MSEKGIETDPEKTRAIQEWPIPRSISEVRSFIGLCSYYRKFVHHFAEIAAPLHDLTKKHAAFRWEERHHTAFSQLKTRHITSPVLSMPTDDGL